MTAALSLLAAGVGPFFREDSRQFAFTTVQGETVQIRGQGWYRYDTPLAALRFPAADMVTLFLVVPA